jgi:hypothetical protein
LVKREGVSESAVTTSSVVGSLAELGVEDAVVSAVVSEASVLGVVLVVVAVIESVVAEVSVLNVVGVLMAVAVATAETRL